MCLRRAEIVGPRWWVIDALGFVEEVRDLCQQVVVWVVFSQM